MEPESIVVTMGKYEMRIPRDLRYTDNHLWVRRVDGNQLQIGITDPQVKFLGGIIVVDFQVEQGADVEQGDIGVVLEAYKTTSNIDCPAPGKVLRINEELCGKTRTVETDPYEKGWFLLLETPEAEACVETLLKPEEYHSVILKEAESFNMT